MRKAIMKIIGAIVLVTAGVGAFSYDAQPVQTQECIYADYRNPDGACWGPTTRLCEGDADCKTAVQ